ncbi:MAG TPA: hypothetical protein DCR25_05215 [Rhodobacter sp.]|nr:hypothetical protein [Rhodobacter sp.]
MGQWRGQTHHFFTYASKMELPQVLPYAPNRWHSELKWLYGVLVSKLTQNKNVTGPDPTNANMAVWPWTRFHKLKEHMSLVNPAYVRVGLTRWPHSRTAPRESGRDGKARCRSK